MTTSGPPKVITPAIESFCAELVPGSRPLFVDVRPTPGAQAQNCFIEVEERIRAAGGAAVFGWAIWEWPYVLLESEFHSVWRDPNGALVDITPKPIAAPRILFLPDPSRVYEGRQIEPARTALSAHDDVTDLMAILGDEYEFLNRGARADQHGEIRLVEPEASEWEYIQRRKIFHMLRAAQFGDTEKARAILERTPDELRRERNRRKKQRQRS